MKRCFSCGETKDRSEFYAHSEMGDGLLGKCKTCTKSDVKINRLKRYSYYREYDKQRDQLEHRKAYLNASKRRKKFRQPAKNRAHYLASNAIRDGRLTRASICNRCGSSDRIEGHHNDYTKPLELEWLCFRCHRNVHGHLIHR